MQYFKILYNQAIEKLFGQRKEVDPCIAVFKAHPHIRDFRNPENPLQL